LEFIIKDKRLGLFGLIFRMDDDGRLSKQVISK